MKLSKLLFIFSLFLIPLVSALGVDIPTGVAAGNYSEVNVNNSYWLRGLSPQQVADLYVETDPSWTANYSNVLFNNTDGGWNISINSQLPITTTEDIIANSFRADAHEQTIDGDEQTITQTGQSSVALTLDGFMQFYEVGSTNPVFNDGTQIGQVMVVRVIVLGDAFLSTLTIKDDSVNGKVALQGDKIFSSPNFDGLSEDVLIVMWDGSLWQEVYRNLGFSNDFSGRNSGWGFSNDFLGEFSGWGSGNGLTGKYSGWGQSNVLTAYQAVFGRYSTDQGHATDWVATDDLFKIGIGTGTAARADAFRLLKNGESHWETDSKHYYGLGNDVSHTFNSTDWVFNPREVGSGDGWLLDDWHITGDLNVEGNITAENVFLPSFIFTHTNNTIPVAVAGNWYNVTFDEEVADPKKRITHTYNDDTNDTFTIVDDGYYNIHYAMSFSSAQATPTSHVVMRVIKNGAEIEGSLLEEDATKQYSDFTISNGPISYLVAGDKITFQFTSDDTDVSLTSHRTYGDHHDTAVVKIIRIA